MLTYRIQLVWIAEDPPGNPESPSSSENTETPEGVVTRLLARQPGIEHVSSAFAGRTLRVTLFLTATRPITALPVIAAVRSLVADEPRLSRWRLLPDDGTSLGRIGH